MKALLTLIFILCSALLAFAQLVPLELTNTIPLPTSGDIWDVMPHPDGYYLWVQAVRPDTAERTRIYWGRTDSLFVVHTYDLNVGFPTSINCFFRGEHEACFLLASRNIWYTIFDSTVFRIYSLDVGRSDSQFWYRSCNWNSWSLPHGGDTYNNIVRNFRLLNVAMLPAPPESSHRVTLTISHTDSTWLFYAGLMGSESAIDIVPDFLQGGTSWTTSNLCADAASSVNSDSTSLFAFCGDYSSRDNCSATQTILSVEDSLRIMRTYNQLDCSPGIFACTYNTMQQSVLTFLNYNGTYIGSDSRDTSLVHWSVTGPYNFGMAAECVASNSAEEFIAYNNSRRVFDVLGAADGRWYGVTDTVAISTPGARITGRYSETFRRLAFRDSLSLKLYRFGSLAAKETPNLQPSSFALSVYPNPFNPTATLNFALPRAGEVRLNVFDITGRLVKSIADRRMEAGEHQLSFDGGDLSSGIYFARLQCGVQSKTLKMVLLK